MSQAAYIYLKAAALVPLLLIVLPTKTSRSPALAGSPKRRLPTRPSMPIYVSLATLIPALALLVFHYTEGYKFPDVDQKEDALSFFLVAWSAQLIISMVTILRSAMKTKYDLGRDESLRRLAACIWV